MDAKLKTLEPSLGTSHAHMTNTDRLRCAHLALIHITTASRRHGRCPECPKNDLNNSTSSKKVNNRTSRPHSSRVSKASPDPDCVCKTVSGINNGHTGQNHRTLTNGMSGASYTNGAKTSTALTPITNSAKDNMEAGAVFLTDSKVHHCLPSKTDL
jgi:hypothetical protein